MSDHRFEKQVGQKLDDLKLTPSAKSWENIEKEIQTDKRRTAPIFWLPLLLLGLGAIGYFVLNEGNNREVILTESSERQTLNTPLPGSPDGDMQDNKIHSPATDVDFPTYRGNAGSSQPGHSFSPSKPAGLVDQTGDQIRLSTGRISMERSASDKQNQEKIREQEMYFSTDGDPLPQGQDEKVSDPEFKKTIKTPPVNEEEKEEQPSASVAPDSPKTKTKTSKRWAFGMSASGGVSTLSEGKIGFSNAQIATVVNRQPLLSFASPAVMPTPSVPPSKIYPGFAFGVGATAKYNLSKRFSISSGVNYLQLNSITKVGYKLEPNSFTSSNANGTGMEVMYLPPLNEETRKYDNKYHFIEVPVNLHTKVNRSEKLPLFVNAGFSVSRLIKSNSLHYDALEHYYYSDDNLLKKTQTSVSTGVSFVLFNRTKTPLWVGPTVRYNFSKALKEEISPSNKHFMGAGLDIKWFIK